MQFRTRLARATALVPLLLSGLAAALHADEQRFSPLDGINGATVSRLGLTWYADLPSDRGQAATPIVDGRRRYVSTAWSIMQAYDAATGELLWTFNPEVPRESGVNACCDAPNRSADPLA